MRLKLWLAACAGLAFSISSPAATISTGSAPWLVDGNPVATVTSVPSNYIPAFGDGAWVSNTPTAINAPGTYTFTLDLGLLLGVGGVLDLQYGADNSVSWSLTNGLLSGTTSCLNPSGDCFGSVQGAPRSLTGTFSSNSVLTAVVVNDGGTSNPMSLLVVGTATTVPEPSTAALCALGGLILLLRRR